MLFSNFLGTWNNRKNFERFDFTEEEFFSKIPTLQFEREPKALDRFVQTNQGLYNIKYTDRVLYRENPIDFRSGTWYAVYYCETGFIFKVED